MSFTGKVVIVTGMKKREIFINKTSPLNYHYCSEVTMALKHKTLGIKLLQATYK